MPGDTAVRFDLDDLAAAKANRSRLNKVRGEEAARGVDERAEAKRNKRAAERKAKREARDGFADMLEGDQ